MEDLPPIPPAQELKEKKVILPTFGKFLETTPPATDLTFQALFGSKPDGLKRRLWELTATIITSHCLICSGARQFQFSPANAPFCFNVKEPFVMNFTCKNCSSQIKSFAIVLDRSSDGNWKGRKIGEMPPFGPAIPSKVLSTFGKDAPLYRKGWQCENQGMGVAAFAYYRRVVENQKYTLFDEIIKIAKLTNADESMLKNLEVAKVQKQFSTSVVEIAPAMPQSLLIAGQNPLTLLHDALSQGLHAEADEECLAHATDIREVLTSLVERMVAFKKDHQQIDASAKRLHKVRSEREANKTTQTS